jgi:hypothetical protein
MLANIGLITLHIYRDLFDVNTLTLERQITFTASIFNPSTIDKV